VSNDVEEVRREIERLFVFLSNRFAFCASLGEAIYTGTGEVQKASCVVAAHAQNPGIPSAVYTIKKNLSID
jgi:hypothetical protein